MSGQEVFNGIAMLACIAAATESTGACATAMESPKCTDFLSICVARTMDLAERHNAGLIQTCLQIPTDPDQKKEHAAACRYVYRRG